jgi:spoIIIJ-associated protein
MVEIERVIEAAGDDIEAAIAEGLTRLGVERDAVEVEVLDDGSRGLFGIGAREARVRLTVKPQAVSPSEPIFPDPGPSMAEAPGLSPAEGPALSPVEEAALSMAPGLVPGALEESEAEKNTAQMAKTVLLELLALMGMDHAQVVTRWAKPAGDEKDPPLILDVSGPGTDVLIGRRGKTIAALQHIARLVVGREVEGRVHLVVDVDGFKARREKSLRRLARRMAEQAVSTERTVVLEPMPPHERRIIHLVLRDNPNVTTESVGDRDRRKVTIIPRH